MNKNFSIQRFYALFLRYWAEYKIALLILMVLSVPIVYFYETENLRMAILGIFVKGSLSVFMIAFLYYAFRCIDNKNRLGYFLLLPASGLEKFLFLLSAGIILPYLLLLGDFLIVKGFLHFVPQNVISGSEKVSDVSDFLSLSTFISTTFAFFILITIRLLQKQGNIIHSFLMLIGASLLLTLGDNFIILKTLGDHFYSKPFGSLSFSIEKSNFVDNGLIADFLPYSIIAICIFGAAMLYLAFLKYREIEKGL